MTDATPSAVERPLATVSEIAAAERLISQDQPLPVDLSRALLKELHRLKRAAGEGGSLSGRLYQEDASGPSWTRNLDAEAESYPR